MAAILPRAQGSQRAPPPPSSSSSLQQQNQVTSTPLETTDCTCVWSPSFYSCHPKDRSPHHAALIAKPCSHKFHMTGANKEAVFTSAIYPVALHPGSAQTKKAKMPISQFSPKSSFTAHFPSCSQKVVLLISLLLDADCGPPLWDTDGRGTPSAAGSR